MRVEFSGIEFSPDNELNGIAFQAVGRGTQVDHVQAHMSRDDAMEWFGGTVDGKYLVMSNAADDSLDWTFGWSGRVQFVAITAARRRRRQRHRGGQQRVQQQRAAALESADLQHHDLRRPDRTSGVGSPARGEPASRHGVHDPQLPDHRDQDQGFQIETTNTATTGQVDNGTSQMGAGVVWNNLTPGVHRPGDALERDDVHEQRPVPEHPCSTSDAGVSTALLREPREPELPAAVVATLAGGQLAPIQPPNDGFFEAVTFIGAVPPAPAPNWMDGWTSFPQN